MPSMTTCFNEEQMTMYLSLQPKEKMFTFLLREESSNHLLWFQMLQMLCFFGSGRMAYFHTAVLSIRAALLLHSSFMLSAGINVG